MIPPCIIDFMAVLALLVKLLYFVTVDWILRRKPIMEETFPKYAKNNLGKNKIKK